MAMYDAYLAAGLNGELDYLARHRDQKADPKLWLPFANSAIVLTFQYFSDLNRLPPNGNRIALYATYTENQEDYHNEIRRRLAPVLQTLQQMYPEASFRLGLDVEPILERDLAYRAGIGWIGKNTCLIERNRGSLFFISEILTSLEVPIANLTLSSDFCGNCTRCLDACPTQALIEPRKLDAKRCISYWTIESKGVAEKELRTKFGDWFFGCDICQTVCPWNGKVFGHQTMEAHSAAILQRSAESRVALINELREVLTMSNRELERRFATSPLKRARGWGLKRNALYVAGNLKLIELTEEIRKLVLDPKLGQLANDIINEFEEADVT